MFGALRELMIKSSEVLAILSGCKMKRIGKVETLFGEVERLGH